MPAFSPKRLLQYLLLGFLIGIASMVFFRNQDLLLALINSLFLGGLVPFLIGCFLLARRLGAFDLFAYSHSAFKKYGRKHEKQENHDKNVSPDAPKKSGSYAEYLIEKPVNSAFKEPMLIGGILCVCSLLLTILLY